MEKSFIIRYDINNAIALCNIINYLDYFNYNIKNFLNSGFLKVKNNKFRYKKLINLFSEKNKNFNSDIRKFYANNKEICNKIYHYTYFSNFIIENYDINGNIYSDVIDFYKYLINNKENIDKIINNLKKIKSLGFKEFYFKDSSMVDDIYKYEENSNYYMYLDGDIEIIPSINDIKYKSNNANYVMRINKHRNKKNDILLNNLIFDTENLPNSLDFDETVLKIINLYKESVNIQTLKNIINLSVGIEELEKSFHNLIFVIDSMKHFDKKEELLDSLKNIKKELIRCSEINNYYISDTVDNTENLTPDLIANEKRLYKKTT